MQEELRGAPDLVDALIRVPQLVTEGLRVLEKTTRRRAENPLSGLRGTLLAGFCLVAGAIIMAFGGAWPVWGAMFAVAFLLAVRRGAVIMPNQLDAAPAPAHDPFDPEFSRRCVGKVLSPISEHYFRCELRGAERIPREGPVILAANHSGNAFPHDGMYLDAELWRRGGFAPAAKFRTVYEAELSLVWWMRPFGIDNFWRRGGGVDMTFDNFERLIQRGERILYFPEGVPGIGKGFNRRYQLQTFKTSFVLLAARHRVPVYPVHIINGEWIHPFGYTFPRPRPADAEGLPGAVPSAPHRDPRHHLPVDVVHGLPRSPPLRGRRAHRRAGTGAAGGDHGPRQAGTEPAQPGGRKGPPADAGRVERTCRDPRAAALATRAPSGRSSRSAAAAGGRSSPGAGPSPSSGQSGTSSGRRPGAACTPSCVTGTWSDSTCRSAGRSSHWPGRSVGRRADTGASPGKRSAKCRGTSSGICATVPCRPVSLEYLLRHRCPAPPALPLPRPTSSSPHNPPGSKSGLKTGNDGAPTGAVPIEAPQGDVPSDPVRAAGP